MSNKEKLAAMIAAKKPVYADNPYWTMKDGKIWNKIFDEPFSVSRNSLPLVSDTSRMEIWHSASGIISFAKLLPVLIKYFKLNYDSFQSESQVLILTKDDYEKLTNKAIPELDYEDREVLGLHILVLPQVNTFGNTSVSESYWQNEIVKNGITPLMRVHTHHILHAYQSSTDWSTLNSGTLEVVVGNIYKDPEIAYWLDVRGTDNKDTVFRTVDLGEIVTTVPSGRPKKVDKVFDPKKLMQMKKSMK